MFVCCVLLVNHVIRRHNLPALHTVVQGLRHGLDNHHYLRVVPVRVARYSNLLLLRHSSLLLLLLLLLGRLWVELWVRSWLLHYLVDFSLRATRFHVLNLHGKSTMANSACRHVHILVGPVCLISLSGSTVCHLLVICWRFLHYYFKNLWRLRPEIEKLS